MLVHLGGVAHLLLAGGGCAKERNIRAHDSCSHVILVGRLCQLNVTFTSFRSPNNNSAQSIGGMLDLNIYLQYETKKNHNIITRHIR